METIIKWSKRRVDILSVILILAAMGCNQNQDKQIKADINSQAKDNLNFAGINYTVFDGRVKVFGNCPSERTKGKVLETIKGIHIIKGIEDSITIATVKLGQEQQIKESVDSVLVNYPLVTAQVDEKEIILSGSVNGNEFELLSDKIKVFGLPVKMNLRKMSL